LLLNDLLEHKRRRVGSGDSNATVRMSARMIATSNPLWSIENIQDLLDKYDHSLLSRLVIYWQTKDHVDLIRQSRDSELKPYKYHLHINDWIAFVDYLQSFSADYDLKEVEKVYDTIPDVFTEDLKNHYNSRQRHHLECILDGLVKTRCFLTGDISFKAVPEDYERLREVWFNIIKSWVTVGNIKAMQIKDRIHYLPENCQMIYNYICEQKRPVSYGEVKREAMKSISLSKFEEAMVLLKDNAIIYQDGNDFKPHYMTGEFSKEKSKK